MSAADLLPTSELVRVMTDRCVDRSCEGGDTDAAQADSSEQCRDYYGLFRVDDWCDMCLFNESIKRLAEADAARQQAEQEPFCEFCQSTEPSPMQVCTKCWNSANNDTWQRRAISAEAEVSDLRAQIARLQDLAAEFQENGEKWPSPDFRIAAYRIRQITGAARVPPPQEAAT